MEIQRGFNPMFLVVPEPELLKTRKEIMITESPRNLRPRTAILTTPPLRRKEKKSVTDNFGHNAAVSDYFGSMTFGLGQFREKLPREIYNNLVKVLEQGKKLDKDTADACAAVIEAWAISKGVTHFCHWFQPMTGLTAEKHDAFISIHTAYHSELSVVEKFTGSQLIQGEPDASSFPSGGMRTTFEARGYTAWDPTSPLFIIEGETGKTLCIPTVFFGYHGEALDNKTPLLRSVQALSREAISFLKLIGDVDVKSITATLGPEQEYFLIDKRFAALRPDIIMTGRTLLGAPSHRGQQLEDHYFGAIPSRVISFMEYLEHELYKLGIPVKTRHNEVAPSQFELAPIFENVNVASDHNVLTMETLKRVANEHGLMCLLHEKPFARINGSGKHCNWSMSNDKGENLLEPGKTPHQNLRFLAVLAVILKAVYERSDALRYAIASPGNDHRLGANEAPPAIISVFLGTTLSKLLDAIGSGQAGEATERQSIDLGVSHLPEISKDNTDRNRTSPFAFTGNKFEFRAVGSSANVAVPLTFLNAAVANAFSQASTRLKELLAEKSHRDEAVMELIREYANLSKPVRFEGNNYSAEWRTEAKKRGLPILDSSVEALPILEQKEATEFLVQMKVLTREEIKSRHHIGVERYVKTLLIELSTLGELVSNFVIPAVEMQILKSADALKTMSNAALKKAYGARIENLEKTFEQILSGQSELMKVLTEIDATSGEDAQMHLISEKGLPVRERLRAACDQAETLVADDLWPLPKYREMLFDK